MPTLLEAKSADYPENGDGRSADFELGLTLDREGRVLAVDVLSRAPADASPELEAAAVRAARTPPDPPPMTKRSKS